MIRVRQKGKFAKATRYLMGVKDVAGSIDWDAFGKEGVAALASATPVDSGKTANSWYYEITRTKTGVRISFHNSNIQNGVPIAVVIQYGHATRNGGWVEGIDYINPAIQPLFDKIAEKGWREVTKL